MTHNFGTPELRKIHRAYYDAFWKALENNIKPYPTCPEECRGMACGAKTRAGTPCKLKSIYDNGRCKFHGGLSTGPKTADGKRRSAMNGFKPKKKRSS
jgi:hypothetical protein